jgi:hypothetical protein
VNLQLEIFLKSRVYCTKRFLKILNRLIYIFVEYALHHYPKHDSILSKELYIRGRNCRLSTETPDYFPTWLGCFGSKQAAGYPKLQFSFYVFSGNSPNLTCYIKLRVHSINGQSTIPPLRSSLIFSIYIKGWPKVWKSGWASSNAALRCCLAAPFNLGGRAQRPPSLNYLVWFLFQNSHRTIFF